MLATDTQQQSQSIIHPVDARINLASLHRLNPARYPFLLESTAKADTMLATELAMEWASQTPVQHNSNQNNARYSIAFAFPEQSLTLMASGELVGNDIPDKGDFLDNLDSVWQQQNISTATVADIPFQGGWFLYLGYELAGQIETRLNLPTDAEQVIACATRIPAAIIIDHQLGTQYIVSEPCRTELLGQILDDITHASQLSTAPLPMSELSITEEPAQNYLDAVSKVKRYIKEGDVFQVNLSRQWTAEHCSCSAIDIYTNLKRANPAPFAGFAQFAAFSIISSSPERLVRTKNKIVDTRPIAGTRARDNETRQDIARLRELIAHPKERAEHIMLVDLERNDLGRICKPGSVNVNELMTLESFRHVHHIVSNVTGQLRADVTPGEVIRAVFPGGTITGCPKERCMAIIAELENRPRGAYTGSLGYLNHDGSMDLNILIRSIEVHQQRLTIKAGAGLVADSLAEHELEETRAKAKGMLAALQDIAWH